MKNRKCQTFFARIPACTPLVLTLWPLQVPFTKALVMFCGGGSSYLILNLTQLAILSVVSKT